MRCLDSPTPLDQKNICCPNALDSTTALIMTGLPACTYVYINLSEILQYYIHTMKCTNQDEA